MPYLFTLRGAELLGRCVNGNTTGGMLAVLPDLLVREHPDAVLLMGGTNDIAYGGELAGARSNMGAMAHLIIAGGGLPLIGIPPGLRRPIRREWAELMPERAAELLAECQSWLRRFAAAWRDSVLNGQPIPPQRAIAPFLRLVESPTALQLDLLGDLTVEDGVTYPLAAPQHTAHYLTHPRQARRDFAEARWKIGFLQRAVPLPLPYGKLYLKLKK